MSKLRPGFQTTKIPFLCITLVAGLKPSSRSKEQPPGVCLGMPPAEQPIEEQAGKYKALNFPAFEVNM
jgi:hypothetical protein